MEFSIVWIGTGILMGTAFVLAVSISIVTHFFHVEENPKIEEVYKILPHINCGACGFPGCMPYAEAVSGDTDIARNRCRPGGKKVAAQIVEILDGAPAVESVGSADKSGQAEKSLPQVEKPDEKSA